eukprot:131446_1
MEGNYYDIDDILAEGQVLPCTFNVNAVDMGYLDETGECGEDLKKDTTINLPFWLMKPLHLRNMILVERPLYFKKAFAESFLVDPNVVNLRNKCEYWYVLGYKLCKLMDAKEISVWMEKALQSRNAEIIDQSAHYKSHNYDTFRGYLSYIEEKLFDQKHETETYLHKWKNNITSKSSMLGKKRKLMF